MMELQIGGAAAPELVWRSQSPAKHALNLLVPIIFINPFQYEFFWM
jgi:hypothetical protein